MFATTDAVPERRQRTVSIGAKKPSVALPLFSLQLLESRSVAACLACKRKPDIVGRIGGEEFAILLPETALPHAAIVAERIHKMIAETTLTTHRANFKVTASIGIAEASAGMSDFDALMKAADEALYQAKASGRNRVVRWSPAAPDKLAAE